MPKVSPMQASFAGGEVGPLIEGRVDLEDYGQSVKWMESFIPSLQGPAIRSAGTRFAKKVKDSPDRTWLIKFEFNVEQAYILEFGDLYIRFFANHGVVLSGGVPYEVVTPYPVADLTDANGNFTLNFEQSGDIIYITHTSEAYPPMKLSRLAATTWTLTEVDPAGGPFRDTDPATAITVYASATTGTGITLTASAPIFSAGHVGSLFYLERKLIDGTTMWEVNKSITAGNIRKSDGKFYRAVNTATTGTIRPTHTVGSVYDGDAGVQWEFLHPGYGYVKITAFGTSTSVTADVVKRLPDEVVSSGNATSRWAFGEWSAVYGYPTHVTFFKERLVFARASDQRVWMSVSGGYGDRDDFSDRDDGGVVTADSSISVDIQGAQVNKIQWVVPANDLIVGTAGGEFVIRELTKNEPLGPGNVTSIRLSSHGSAPVAPALVGDAIIFVQRSGKKMLAISYSPEAQSFEGYATIDLSIYVPHFFPAGTKISQISFQKEPYNLIWVLRSDGYLFICRYNSNRRAVAWARRPAGGSGIVEAIECIPTPDGEQDELWLIVRRNVQNQDERYIEYKEMEWSGDKPPEDRFYVDCGLTYDGAPATTISGLLHLAGRFVDVLVDGAAHPQRQVSVSGEITLENAASVVQVGLPCPGKLRLLRQNAGAADGTSQGKNKRIHTLTIRLLDTLGGKIGPSESVLDELQFRSGSDNMNEPPPAFTGDKTDIPWPDGYTTDADVWYINDQPMPATVVAIMPHLVTYDK